MAKNIKLMTEREQIKNFFVWFPSVAEIYGWELGICPKHKQEDIADDLKHEDPETISLDSLNEIIRPFEIQWYVYPRECDVCQKTTWNIVEISENGDTDSSIYICNDCVDKCSKMLGELKNVA